MVKIVQHVSFPLSFFMWVGITYRYHYRFLSYDESHFSLCSLTAELLTRIKQLLKPTPNTVHYILTHFKGVWNIVNNIPFLRNSIMRYVLTCKYKSLSKVFSFLKETYFIIMKITKPNPKTYFQPVKMTLNVTF